MEAKKPYVAEVAPPFANFPQILLADNIHDLPVSPIYCLNNRIIPDCIMIIAIYFAHVNLKNSFKSVKTLKNASICKINCMV